MSPRRTFLTAEWRDLAMLNYAIDPGVLAPLVPAGTELDFFEEPDVRQRDRVPVFAHARVWDRHPAAYRFRGGQSALLRAPPERGGLAAGRGFRARARAAPGDRVPRARGLRGALPALADAAPDRPVYAEGIHVEYGWKRSGRWESLHATGHGQPQEIEERVPGRNSSPSIIGATPRGGPGTSSQYQVEHPRWRIWPAVAAGLDADAAALYGARFANCLAAGPAFTFIAEGSAVAVRKNLAV